MTGEEWLCDKIGYIPTKHFRVMTHEVNGEIVGAVGYDGWTGTACNIHWAGTGWTPRFLAAALYYPFVMENCIMVLAQIPSGNEESLKLMERLDFIKILTITDAHPDGELHVYMLRRENSKLLKRYYHA